MGRGDRKTTRGKIAKRSYGNVRPHDQKTPMAEGEVRSVAKKVVSRSAAKPVVPVRKAPSKAPAKAPVKAPGKAPAKAPVKAPVKKAPAKKPAAKKPAARKKAE